MRLIPRVRSFLVFAFCCLALGCGRERHGVIVGIMEPRNGQNAVYGLPASNGALAAFQRAERDGVPISVLPPEDIGGGGDLSRQAYARLRDAGAAAIVGPGISSEMLAVGPIAQRDQRVLVGTTCESVKISEIGDFIFRVYPNYRGNAKALAEYLARRQQGTRVSVLAERSDFGRDFARLFEEQLARNGGTLLRKVEHAPDEADFKAVLVELLNVRPDVLVMSSQVAQMRAILRQAREAGFTGIVAAPSSFFDMESVRAVGKSAVGLVVVAYPFDIEENTPTLRTFKQAYEAQFHQAPSQWAAYGWDAANVVVAAVRAGARSADEIQRFLHTGGPFEGVTGRFSFDAHGDVDTASRIYVVDEQLVFKPADTPVQATR
jgi:branched-chain amino acid transport system substrate-binding protein